MNLRQYLLILALGTAVALGAWAIVLMAIDPATAGGLSLLIFYVTLGSGLVGLFTIVGTVLRARKFKDSGIGIAVTRSLRQGTLLSILLIASLILLSTGRFSTPLLFLMVGISALIEFFFLFFQERHAGIETETEPTA
ncbi:MAG: hypothetical protein WC802_00755 [Patescibacteria group bacterium]|jgi:hypothetical protein